MENSHTFLIAEDSEDIRKAVAVFLRKMDFHVVEMEDGQKAWHWIEDSADDFQFVAVLSDYMMPHLSGGDLLEKVRSHPKYSDIPFFIFSASDDEFFVHDAKRFRANGYWLKPLSFEMLKKNLTPFFPHLSSADPSPQKTATQAVEVSATEEVINLDNLQANFAGATEIIPDIVSLFIENAPEMIENISQAVDRLDAVALQATAHKMKSSVSHFHATTSTRLLQALEDFGSQDELSEAASTFQKLTHQLELLEPELKKLAEKYSAQ